MAVKLIANYAKRLGLPGYSSHQFSVSVETELRDVEDVAAESARLYATLQQSVDEQIKQTGFVPAVGYGMDPSQSAANGHSHPQRHADNGETNGTGNGAWRCSDKQRDFIERIVREHSLNKNDVETLAVELFGVGVKQCDRLQASGLIDELLERHGNKPRGQRRPYRREPAHSQTRGGDGE